VRVRALLAARAAGALALCACGGGGGAPGASADASVDVTFFDAGSFGVEASNGENAATPPPPPVLGAQIDRVGRPGINLMLDHVFDTTPAAGTAKDAYNADAVPSHWASYTPEIARNLAVYDALDGVCGNQLGATSTSAPLAPLLAADALWVDTAATSCAAYLAVERAALGQAGAGDCGGWAPTEDAMDVFLNATVGTESADGGAGSLSNGITTPTTAPLSTFPFLAPPG
jgi:hypothetical protein